MDSEKRKKVLHFQSIPGFGIICGLLSSAFFTANVLCAKLIKSIHPCEIALLRCMIQAMITLPILTYKWKLNQLDIIGPTNNRLLLLIRGITGSTAMVFLYLSLEKIPAGDAVTISFTNTMYISIIAFLFLGEPITILDIVLILLSISGVVLIAQPPFIFGGSSVDYNENLDGILFAVATSILAAITFNIIRKLGKKTHFLLNIYSYSMMGSISTTLFLIMSGLFRFPCFSEIKYFLLVGISGFLGQSFLTLALQVERAGTVSILKSTQIIGTFLLQIWIIGDIPTLLCSIGAGLILLSTIIIGIKKIYKSIKVSQKEKNDKI